MRALEEELARLRAESKAQRDALNAVTSRVAPPVAAGGGDAERWLPWLLGLLLAMLAGLIYLAIRVQALARERAPSQETRFLAQHAVLERRMVEGASALVDAQESPLAWLARRKLVGAAEFEAGERLRRLVREALRRGPTTTPLYPTSRRRA